MSCCHGQSVYTKPLRPNVARELAACDACNRSVLGPHDTIIGCRDLVVFGKAWCPRKWREQLTTTGGHCPKGRW